MLTRTEFRQALNRWGLLLDDRWEAQVQHLREAEPLAFSMAVADIERGIGEDFPEALLEVLDTIEDWFLISAVKSEH